jgi:hypothetical protein
MNPHLHEYRFDSIIVNGHKHKIKGYTESMLGINILHFHYLWAFPPTTTILTIFRLYRSARKNRKRPYSQNRGPSGNKQPA